MNPNPIRLLKNLFVDFLLAVSGTWIGAPDDEPWPAREAAADAASRAEANPKP